MLLVRYGQIQGYANSDYYPSVLVRYGGTYAIYNSADGLNHDTLRMVADARGGKMTALNRYGGEIEAQRSASLLQMQVMILSGFVESRAFFGGRPVIVSNPLCSTAVSLNGHRKVAAEGVCRL